MKAELDPNAIAAEFLKQNLDDIFEGAKSFFKEAADKIRLNLDRTYARYLTTLFAKHSKTKSFLLRGEPVSLYQFYVPVDLVFGKKTIPAAGIRDISALATNTIVTGSAGSGKSMLARHLLLDSLLSKFRVPIFVELREFNFFDGDLLDLIMKTLTTYKFSMGLDYVKKAIEIGHFIILLDGYDEVAHSRRQHVRSTIHNFLKLNEKNLVILTSRPDPELEGWELFSIATVAPLTLSQACSLVEKLPFDDELKGRFLTDLRSDLFQKHHSFLSNPLLLSIMLLSYGQSASIPTKLSVFYNQAYEALFERHDVLKEGFKRQLLSSLDIQDFARLFSAFCLQAYDNHKLEFTYTEALDYIESSRDIVGIQCDKDNYLKDLIQAVCLMVQDGMQIVYPHRSFQEYFAARFICETRPEVQEQLINKYSDMVLSDNVFSMLCEMRPEIIERHYIMPGLKKLFDCIGVRRSLGISHHKRFVRTILSRILITPNSIAGFGLAHNENAQPLFHVARFTFLHCGHHLTRWKNFFDQKWDKVLVEKWYKKLSSHISPPISPHKGTKVLEVDIKDKLYGREIIRDLAHSDGFLSVQMLQALLEIKAALTEKVRLEHKTLESILGNKNRKRRH